MSLLVSPIDTTTTRDPEKLARQIEAQFFQILMKEMRKTVPQDGLLAESAGGSFGTEMFDQVIADQVAGSTNLGLGQAILRQLGLPGSSATPIGQGPLETPAVPQATPGPITSGYGMRTDPIHGKLSFHHGVDIGAEDGQPVHSIGPGTVIQAGPADGYGNLVRVRRADGVEVLYGHLSEVSVKAGNTVNQGSHLGAVGSTGRSTGPHLHLEVRNPNGSLNPRRWADLGLGR